MTPRTASAAWRSVWLRVAISAAILAYLTSRIDMAAALAALLRVRLGHVAAVLALVGLDRGVMIGRWLLVLRSSGQQIAVKSVAWIFLVSSFIGSALPAGVGADAARAYTLSRRTDNTSEAIASVTVDRVLGVLSLAVLAITGAMLWGTANDALPIGWIWMAAGPLATAALAFMTASRVSLSCFMYPLHVSTRLGSSS